MVILSVTEAEWVIPGFKASRLMNDPAEEMGRYVMPSKDWPAFHPEDGKHEHAHRQLQEMDMEFPSVKVFQGMTVRILRVCIEAYISVNSLCTRMDSST
jgi:hypothetical protein